MIQKFGKPNKDDDGKSFNDGMHRIFGYPKDGIEIDFKKIDLGPYGDDINSFRIDLDRIYDDSFFLKVWNNNLDESLRLGKLESKRGEHSPSPSSKSMPPSTPEASNSGEKFVFDVLGVPTKVTTQEMLEGFSKLFYERRFTKTLCVNPNLSDGLEYPFWWHTANKVKFFHGHAKDIFCIEDSKETRPEIKSMVANLLNRLNTDFDLGMDRLSITTAPCFSSSANDETVTRTRASSDALTSSSSLTQNTNNETVTRASSSADVLPSSSNSTSSVDLMCTAKCLGGCKVGMCMFYSGLIPLVSQDPASLKFMQDIEKCFWTNKDPQVVLLCSMDFKERSINTNEHIVFVPLKVKSELEINTGGTRCYYVNTNQPEYIYTNRVGFDVLVWKEQGELCRLFAGQLFKSNSKESGLRFVLKILRGKCKDNKIYLLVAFYENDDWIVRYMRSKDSHKEFLSKNTPMTNFVSPELQSDLSLRYHEQTTSLYKAFDAMGGLSEGLSYAEFRTRGKCNLNDDQLCRLLSRAFPEEKEPDRSKGLHIDDLMSFTLIAPHQFNTANAKRDLEHRKANQQCHVHSSEGTLD